MLKWRQHLLFLVAQLVLDGDTLGSSLEGSVSSCVCSDASTNTNTQNQKGGNGKGGGGGSPTLNNLTNNHLKNIPPRG
jgi:hypothetical protein